MHTEMVPVVVVIPARGNSKGIPRKNARLMAGRPLLAYAIATALSIPSITHVIVSTEDEELASIALEEGAQVSARDERLSGDDVTLDPVVHDAVVRAEADLGVKFGIVITLQPTSPLLTSTTLRRAIDTFLSDSCDSLVSVVNRPHLSWSASPNGFTPNFVERKNRQWLPPHLVETGAFVISKRRAVTPNSRLGNSTTAFEVPTSEAIDIDDSNDWLVCETSIRRKRIVFRADGHALLGMGHIFHCLTLAYRMMSHEVQFVTMREHSEGAELLQNSQFPVHLIDDEEDFYRYLASSSFDVVVVDCLDTTVKHIQSLKSMVARVVTIEDLGPGGHYADAVINALYEGEEYRDNIFTGARYVCLRDEFVGGQRSLFRPEVRSVLVMFGGTDPTNLTRRMFDLARTINLSGGDLRFDFILGPGYVDRGGAIRSTPESSIFVHRNVKRVSSIMRTADLAITSQGRTVFELAAMGVPAIVLAQNEREQLHTFAQMQNGFVNLGLGAEVSDSSIEGTFRWLVETPQVRQELRELMERHDLASGVDRVVKIVLGDLVEKGSRR